MGFGGKQGDGGRAAWAQLDIDITPGHYHFAPQSPRTPMCFRRAAVMRGYETDMGAPGVGEVTLTVHDKPVAGQTPVADCDLPEFDIDAAGTVAPRTA